MGNVTIGGFCSSINMFCIIKWLQVKLVAAQPVFGIRLTLAILIDKLLKEIQILHMKRNASY
jgi:hypothetical protein